MAIGNRQEVYLTLKRRILTLDLEPGSNLDETTISSEFGISRTPLRDIFRQLAGEGYICIVGNRGASVSSMNHKTLRDFFQTAPLIYASISRLAVQNATPQQVADLKTAQDKFRQASITNNVDDLVFFNERFHSILGEMADNQFLMPSLQRLLIDHARIAQTFYQKTNAQKGDRLRLAVDQHDQMIAAIEAGDEEKIVAVTLDHWELSRSQADLFVRPDPLPLDISESA